jgi:hypothetical protein
MKKYIVFLLMILTANVCKSQERFDLEKLTFKEDVTALLKDKIKHGDNEEIATTLPAYLTFDVEGFKYGPVNFTHGGEQGEDAVTRSGITFLLNSVTEKKIVGIIIKIQKSAEAKQLNEYIRQKYGEPVVLAGGPKPDKQGMLFGFPAYFWKNIQPDVSLVMVKQYTSINDKQAFGTVIYIVKNDAETSVPTTFKTVLNRIIYSAKASKN